MLITFAFIVFLTSALANDPPSLNAGSMIDAASNGPTSSETFVAQTQRLLSNFDPKEFISSIKQWPQKIKIQAIQNAIHHGYLNSLGEQPEFLVGIGRWPSSVKMMILYQAMSDGNKKIFEAVLNSLNPNENEDQKILENIYHGVFMTRENLKYAGIIIKFSCWVPAELIESIFVKAAWDGDMQILPIFLNNLNCFASSQMIEKFGINAYQVILQKGLEASKKNRKTKSVRFIQHYLDFSLLRGKSVQEVIILTKNISLNRARWLVLISYSYGEDDIVQAFLSLKENEKFIKDLIKWDAGHSHWDALINLGRFFPADLTQFIVEHPALPDRVELFGRFLQEVSKLSAEHIQSRRMSPEDLIRSYIFLKICQSGQIDLMNVFFENPALMDGPNIARNFQAMFREYVVPNNNLASQMFSINQLDASKWMIYYGIIGTSYAGNHQMLNFLLSKIDVSANGNFLLKLAVIATEENLVRLLIRNEQVTDAGLDDAIQYAIAVQDFQIYELLRQTKSILEVINTNMVARAA